MVETTLPDGLETSGRRVYRWYWNISRRFWVFAFWMNFSLFQKNLAFGYSLSSLLWYRCYYPHRSSLFAPTSQSRMSNIFRDSKSLGKSNGKKWSHIWTFLFGSCLKSPRKKKFSFFFVADFALQNMVETTLPDGLETSGRRVYRWYWHISRPF